MTVETPPAATRTQSRKPVPPATYAAMAIGGIALVVIVLIILNPKTPPAPAPVAAASTPADAKALHDRIAELEAELAKARDASSAAAPPPAVSAADAHNFDARLARLEAEQRAEISAAGEALAAAALADAAASARPFVGELNTLERAAPTDRLAETLRPLAEKGVPTRAALSAAFADSATQIVAATRAGPSGHSGFAASLQAAAARLFTVRRVGDLTGNTLDARLARAERAARQGELEEAVSELGALPPETGLAAAAWLDAARNRILVDKTVSRLRNQALKRLTDVDPGPEARP